MTNNEAEELLAAGGETLEEPDSLMLLNLIKDEIVNELQLPSNVSAAMTPAFAAFEQALKKANVQSGVSDLDSQVVLEIAKRFTNWDEDTVTTLTHLQGSQ